MTITPTTGGTTVTTSDRSFEEIADAVHEAERKAFHLDDPDYLDQEKDVFDALAEGVVGYEREAED
jgi:hypothetical protein